MFNNFPFLEMHYIMIPIHWLLSWLLHFWCFLLLYYWDVILLFFHWYTYCLAVLCYNYSTVQMCIRTCRVICVFLCNHIQTPQSNWMSPLTQLVSPTWVPTIPSPSPALPLSLKEWSHQRHSPGVGVMGHQHLVCTSWPTMVTPSSSPPPTWTSPPAPVYWQWERPLLETMTTPAGLTSVNFLSRTHQMSTPSMLLVSEFWSFCKLLRFDKLYWWWMLMWWCHDHSFCYFYCRCCSHTSSQISKNSWYTSVN